MTTTTAPNRFPQTAGDVQIVPLTASSADVRIDAGKGAMSIGRVGASNGAWYWQHRDGEQSSPIAANRSEAAQALAQYHRAFKVRPAAPAAPTRKLLFS